MKKYKLIKEYPESPKLNDVAESCKAFKNKYIVPETTTCESYDIYNPENYPEFWEEIIEKDYEILSLKYIKPNNWLWDYKTNQIIKCKITDNKLNFKRSNGSWDSYDSDYIGFVTEVFSIYSIRRLSDGEIFTIGDNIKAFDRIEIIKNFYQGMHNSQKHMMFWNLGYSINEFVKVKQPLFTTEDNVDIFEGDTIYMIDKFDYSFTDGIANNKDFGCNKLRFSTKEKVEEYILMNKPCLSINDVAKVFVSTNYITLKGKLYPQGQSLRDMVKNKLKNENNKK